MHVHVHGHLGGSSSSSIGKAADMHHVSFFCFRGGRGGWGGCFCLLLLPPCSDVDTDGMFFVFEGRLEGGFHLFKNDDHRLTRLKAEMSKKPCKHTHTQLCDLEDCCQHEYCSYSSKPLLSIFAPPTPTRAPPTPLPSSPLLHLRLCRH